MTLATGSKAPEFSLKNAAGSIKSLADYRGQWVVVYFYPKDNTPGCTLEANEFSDAKSRFFDLNASIIGVSPDSCRSHMGFIKKQGLEIELLSDPDKDMLEAYGVWKEKSMYGRTYMGVERTTFLVDPKGVIAHIWSKVKVNGHVEEVLKKLTELK